MSDMAHKIGSKLHELDHKLSYTKGDPVQDDLDRKANPETNQAAQIAVAARRNISIHL